MQKIVQDKFGAILVLLLLVVTLTTLPVLAEASVEGQEERQGILDEVLVLEALENEGIPEENSEELMEASVDSLFGTSEISTEIVPLSESTQFTISTLGAAGNKEITRVQFPVWSSRNGQDDLIWYQGNLTGNGEYSVTVDIKNHGFETGDYNTHTYIHGANDAVLRGDAKNYDQRTTSPKIEVDQTGDADGFRVRLIGGSNPQGVKEVQFPVWTNSDGQDDLKWISGSYIGNNTWEGRVDFNDFKQTFDTFSINVYRSNNAGQLEGIGGIEKTIAYPFVNEKIEVAVSQDLSNSNFTISTKNANGKFGVKEIRFPVWSNHNGQDDLRWYAGSLGGDGNYHATVNIENHGFESGDYSVHSYAYGRKGEMLGVATDVFNIKSPRLAINNNEEPLNNTYKIIVSHASSPGGVATLLFPTWSSSNGQDDLYWSEGKYIGDNTWEVTIDLRHHNGIIDSFVSHVYAKDKNGNLTNLGETTKKITQNTSTVYGDFAYPLDKIYKSNPNDPTDWFGDRWGSVHEGIDIPAPYHAACYAVGDGVVEKAGYFMGYGRYVRIRCTDHYGRSISFFYGHLQTINVSVGQTVKKGDIVGGVGGSGYGPDGKTYIDNAYGEHLHFGAIVNSTGSVVDPEYWIDFHNPYSNDK